MHWHMAALGKYADFRGRARRKEFWFFALFYAIFYLTAVLADMWMGTWDGVFGLGPLSALYTIAMLIPYVAVLVRRLHDTGRRGWWFLLVLIPILGTVFLLCLLALDGQPGENRFGPDPKLDGS